MASYAYDALGNKISETDGNGNTVQYEYDPARRVTKQVFPTVTEFVTVDYDDAARTKTVTNTRNEVTRYSYGVLGRLTEVVNKAPDKSQPAVDYTTTYAYDLAGNLTMVTNPNGATIAYEYGNLNRLMKVTNPAPLGTVEYTYTNSGQVKTKKESHSGAAEDILGGRGDET